MSTLLLNIFIAGYIVNKYITIGYTSLDIFSTSTLLLDIFSANTRSVQKVSDLFPSRQ